MKKTTVAWVAFFLTTYGVIVLLVTKASTMSVEGKALLVVGHAIAYMTIIYTEVSKFRDHFGSAEQWLKTLSNVGKAGRKREIYVSMGNALGYLSRYAYLTYFNDQAPDESNNKTEIAYHAQLVTTIASRPDTTFRRIIALLDTDSAAKRAWVEREIKLAESSANYTVRFIEASDQLQLPLNAQIFDDFVFLIDPSRSNEDTLARDIHFLSSEIASIWFRYYREIWVLKTIKQLPSGYLPTAATPVKNP